MNKLTGGKQHHSYKFTLFADYRQFYIEDKLRPGNTADPSFWDNESLLRMLAVAPGTIGISTVGTYSVPLEVELWDAKPETLPDLGNWDHVVEAGLEVSSKEVVVRGPSDIGNCIAIQPQTYRVQVYYGALNIEDAYNIEGADHYRICLWPEAYTVPKVLKQWMGIVELLRMGSKE